MSATAKCKSKNISQGRDLKKSDPADAFAKADKCEDPENPKKEISPESLYQDCKIEILDDIPQVMRRPLSMLNQTSYAVVWMYTREVRLTGCNVLADQNFKAKTGTKSIFVMREDGTLFGPGGDKPLYALPFAVSIPLEPENEQTWSPKGVKAFQKGHRADPVQVYWSIVALINHFLDFDRSLADQKTMCEFISLYILSTWFLPAITVVGYLWPNGEKGSGKTNLLILVASLSYLGKLILAGSTYPTLRDLADIGATLAFDDAENLANVKTTDPDKSTLLLAGNRVGASVQVKEPHGKNGWKTRTINAFCPKVFSAIKCPYPTLSSRSIIIPLVKSLDKKRMNIDPADLESWPVDRRGLLDDLWNVALAHQINVKASFLWVGVNSSLLGRDLQPWHAVLAVAKWLDGLGIHGLYEKMENLARSYQNEKPDLEFPDFTLLVIQVIADIAAGAVIASGASGASKSGGHQFKFRFNATQTKNRASEIILKDDLDFSTDYVTTPRIGRIFSHLRIHELPRPHGRGPRIREMSLIELKNLCDSYNLELPSELQLFLQEDARGQEITGTSGAVGASGSDECVQNPEKDESPLSEFDIPTNEEFRSDDAAIDAAPSNNCFACGDFNWQERPLKFGGGLYCATCHPGPDKGFVNGAEIDRIAR